MTVTIHLPGELETELIAQAHARGLDLPTYVEQVLREQAPARSAAGMSPNQRAEGWRRSTEGLPHTPPLSDDAISRDSIYRDRG